MSGATFPKSARLLRPNEFTQALRGKRIGRGAFFMLSRYVHYSSPDSNARLGLIIAKRHAQKAASRNAIKRVIRESFRVRRHQLPPGDYIVRLHRKIPDCSLTELKKITRQELDSLFDTVKDN
ncbi:Ribonuclease P protein component [Oligella sp. MSHR50489EDL]|uniref:ribonuclease P protein component n=1 Tax=Oligella sp. MSHR50489EDL TaxID=3139409 RepID=UPI003D812C7B